MTQDSVCGDGAALVSYLYDECPPEERRAMEAHLAICQGCADEVEALGGARAQLAAWTPPDVHLGFRMNPEPTPRADVRLASWWRQPLPAWAQMAAAAAIFSLGLSVGLLRSSEAPSATATVAVSPSLAPTEPERVTSGELASLEARLRAEIRLAQGAAPPVVSGPPALEQVRALIEDSERRQQRELTLRTAEIVRDFDAQRRVDMARMERTVGQMEGTTGAEVQTQRQMLDYLMRVSQGGQ